jgi:adenylate kinase
MRSVLLGAPGSGKGTQAGIISAKLGIAHIASGDLFREAVGKGDEVGRQAQSYMEKGLLVPDEITIRMILERVASPDCAKGFILDGFPRTLEQAEALDMALGERGQAIDQVFYIKVDTEELARRLSDRFICRSCQKPYNMVASPPKVAGRCDQCGGELYQRPDDIPDTVRRRIEVYLSETAPLIDYYEKSGKLVEVDGIGEIGEVGERLIAVLHQD